MERFHLYRPPGAGGAFMAAADDGPWVRLADAQAAFDAANQRATETERRLALAVAELAKWREGHDADNDDHGQFLVYAEDVTPCEEERGG